MPLYEYRCDACGQRFDVIQKFSDPAPEQCPTCGKGPAQRQISSPAIQFKGSGFYITDYAKKEKGTSDTQASSSEKTEKSEQSEKTDTSDKSVKTEKKPDSVRSDGRSDGGSDAGTKTNAAPAPPAPSKPSSET